MHAYLLKADTEISLALPHIIPPQHAGTPAVVPEFCYHGEINYSVNTKSREINSSRNRYD